MKLAEHKSLEEKKEFFSNQESQFVINTKSEFDALYDSLVNQADKEFKLYRGISEAKYLTYTSAQRYYITKEIFKIEPLFRFFIRSLIENTKKAYNGLLQEYFKSLNVEIDDYLILSFLQHYGAPSTFLDFSYNLNKSLYFCFDKMDFNPSDNEIDNYVSLYVIDKRYFLPLEKNYEAIKLAKVYDAEGKELKDLEEKMKEHEKDFEVLGQMVCSFVDGCKNQTGYSGFISNLNLIAQEGAFLFYYNITTPLEGFMKNDKIPWTCYNIHKSLKDYVVKKYLNGLSEKNIYPKEEEIAQDALKSFLEQDRIIF